MSMFLQSTSMQHMHTTQRGEQEKLQKRKKKNPTDQRALSGLGTVRGSN